MLFQLLPLLTNQFNHKVKLGNGDTVQAQGKEEKNYLNQEI